MLILRRCYLVISHKVSSINWYFSLPLLSFPWLLHIFCTTSGRGVGGQTKKEMKYSLARKGYKDKWYHSNVRHLWMCCTVRSAACWWAASPHLFAMLLHLPLFCCKANDKDDIKPFYPGNPNASFRQGLFCSLAREGSPCQSLAEFFQKENPFKQLDWWILSSLFKKKNISENLFAQKAALVRSVCCSFRDSISWLLRWQKSACPCR